MKTVGRIAAVLVCLATLAGCLQAPGHEHENQPDAGVPESPGDDAQPADDAAPVEGGQDAAPVAPCSERLPGVISVEAPDTHHCYFVGQTVDYFDVASQDCAALGAHVVQVDESEAKLLAEDLLLAEASWWIGLRHTEDADAWKWVTGELLGPWDAFGEGQPSGDSECVELFIDPVGDCVEGCWNDLFCQEHKKAAICELEP